MTTADYQKASRRFKELSASTKALLECKKFALAELPPRRTTGKRVCEFISEMDIFIKPLTPEQIWNYSPSGELYMVFEWYGLAIEKRNWYRKLLGLN